MVPIEHHTTVHDIDWAQPTGHGPIVHENDCAPCRLDTLPVDTIVHQSTVHRVDCARPIGHGWIVHRYNCAPYSLNTVSVGKIEHRSFVHRIDCARAIRHDSVMHSYKWAPERLHTPFFEQVGTRELSTKLTVHHRLSTIQLHTSETGHRVDWTRVQLRTVSIEHALTTWITVICTEKTDKITYVLLVKIVTDEPINSPNFYRWLWEQTFFLLKFLFKMFILIIWGKKCFYNCFSHTI